MRRTLWIAAALLLAGCADSPEPAPVQETEPEGMVVRGVVQTLQIAPLANANVTIAELNVTETTQADGSFAFPPLPLDFYTVTADATDYTSSTTMVSPGSNESLVFTLEPVQEQPVIHRDRYKGNLDCAAEYLIIAGSCDRVSTASGGPELFDQESIFVHPVQANWVTVVVDVVFESSAQTYDGLRVTTKGGGDQDELGEYEQFGRFHGREAFTFRIEPGGEYPEGTGPVSQNATTFVFDVFAQGHGWHAVCSPPEVYDECFLGLGAGTDIQFELIVSTFYVEPAPEGYTLR